jgi:hypothetical protein
MTTCSSIGDKRVLKDVLGGDVHAIGWSDRCRRYSHHGMDDTHIEGGGDVVDDVPGDDDEDGPAMETARARTTCCDARRGAPVCGACGCAVRLVAGACRCRCRSRGASGWWWWVTQSDLWPVKPKNENTSRANRRTKRKRSKIRKKDVMAANQPDPHEPLYGLRGRRSRLWRSTSRGRRGAEACAAARSRSVPLWYHVER